MSDMKIFLLALIVLLGACKTTAPTTGEASDRQLFGDDPLEADWQEWTPQDARSTPAQLADTATAFDYWQVTDAAQIEEAWAAIYGVLTEVRRVAPRKYDPTFRMLMTVLEPDMNDGDVHLDTTFFAARTGTTPMFEGVSWRLWRELPSGATPGVTVWMRRQEAGSERAREIFVWFYGGFEQAKSLTLHLDGTRDWTMTAQGGVVTAAETPMKGEAQLLSGILLQTFWQPVIGSSYLETPIQKREPTTDTPPQQPIALGLSLGDRDIDQVFTDSVFAPRLTLFPTKQ